MRKIFILVTLFVFTAFNINLAFANDSTEETTEQVTEQVNACPVNSKECEISKKEIRQNTNIENLRKFVADYEKLQNKHNLTALKQVYSDDFVNADGYNKTQLFNLISQTLSNYPDIQNTYEIADIIPGDNFATIFLNQTVSATTKENSKITNDKGEYNAKLKMVMYLKKYNNKWKIYSEDVNYESSTLAFGSAKGVEAEVNAPQKVLANTDYCAGFSVDVPEGYNAIASVNVTQLVDNYKMTSESYRQIEKDKQSLERVIKANNDGNNEAVMVSIGFTKQENDMFKKPKIELSGLLILFQRVDIIPANSNLKTTESK